MIGQLSVDGWPLQGEVFGFSNDDSLATHVYDYDWQLQSKG